MPDPETMRNAIEALVKSTLDHRNAELRSSLVDQLVSQFGNIEPKGSSAAPASSSELNGALRSLQDSTTQTDILRSLVSGTELFCARSALLVVRGNSAQGWQARGFSEDQALRQVSIDCTQGIAARVLQSFEPVAGSFQDLAGTLAEHASAPSDGNVLLLPLIIKDKVSALLYADGGDHGVFDGSAVDILVRSAAMWLELLTLRRAAGIVTEPARRAEHHPVEHAPKSIAKPDPRVDHPTPPPEVVSAPVPPSPSNCNGNGNGNGNGAAGVMEDELHNKARRFAKLLVDEIKLYNQAKVSEGRQARDLYSRLKDDIDKSRATYERRYGQISDVDYFRQELVRVLADNDPALLGASFAQPA